MGLRRALQASAEAVTWRSKLGGRPIDYITGMTAIEEEDDVAVAAQADDIAKKLTEYLIDGFKTKTGRDPSNDEIEQLFEELTPERYAIFCIYC